MKCIRFKRIIVFALVLFLGIVSLGSCQSSKTTISSSSIISITESVNPINTYVVEFINNGHGNSITNQNIEEGKSINKPSDPSEDGWVFEGWYIDELLTKEYDFSSTVTSNMKLYAKWSEDKVSLDKDSKPTIYLVGDSTVQTYAESQYIGGWGQYFGAFLSDEVKVVNAARGGRSSRSFINEDRLFKPEGSKYSFSENGGKSIEETINTGDFLFIQFGHNDDDTKGYSTMVDRMVPLGEPDSNGIYPVIAPSEKKSTSYLPEKYTSLASASEISTIKAEIAKYGEDYYAYGDGTYKWYLKQYIDLARSKGAIPVLCTPVARVSFNSDGTLKSGAGLHGEDFAYVKAVRQLANEENCLLIDNFSFTKKLIETATKSYADFLMAIVPNTLENGPWPSGYDNAYNNSNAGYQKMEATHYNKYGAYITAAYVAEAILECDKNEIIKGKDNNEYFSFVNNVKTSPKKYIDPSNRISISMVEKLEGLLEIIKPTNPNRNYVQPEVAIKAIEALAAKGDISSIDSSNYLTWKEYCQEARAVYESLNYDYRSKVTNYALLQEYEAKVVQSRPKPVKTVVLSASDFVDSSKPVVSNGVTFTFDPLIIEYGKKSVQFTHNDNLYVPTTKSIRLAGNASITSSPTKYIEFELDGPCDVTIVASGGGSTARYIQMVDESKKITNTFEINPSQTICTQEIASGGTYKIGSKSSNIDVYYIIIEYYND